MPRIACSCGKSWDTDILRCCPRCGRREGDEAYGGWTGTPSGPGSSSQETRDREAYEASLRAARDVSAELACPACLRIWTASIATTGVYTDAQAIERYVAATPCPDCGSAVVGGSESLTLAAVNVCDCGWLNRALVVRQGPASIPRGTRLRTFCESCGLALSMGRWQMLPPPQAPVVVPVTREPAAPVQPAGPQRFVGVSMNPQAVGQQIADFFS